MILELNAYRPSSKTHVTLTWMNHFCASPINSHQKQRAQLQCKTGPSEFLGAC